MKIPEGKQLNAPTPEGRELGENLVRLLGGFSPDCCQTCAFRPGTWPNGCGPSLLDALECLQTGEDFFCHEGLAPGQEPWKVCAGFIYAQEKSKQVLTP